MIPENDMPEKVLVRDIGIGFDAGEEETPWYGSVEKEDLDRFLTRTPMGNKGTFGKVLVLAGSGAMCGAAVLCAGQSLHPVPAW